MHLNHLHNTLYSTSHLSLFILLLFFYYTSSIRFFRVFMDPNSTISLSGSEDSASWKQSDEAANINHEMQSDKDLGAKISEESSKAPMDRFISALKQSSSSSSSLKPPPTSGPRPSPSYYFNIGYHLDY